MFQQRRQRQQDDNNNNNNNNNNNKDDTSIQQTKPSSTSLQQDIRKTKQTMGQSSMSSRRFIVIRAKITHSKMRRFRDAVLTAPRLCRGTIRRLRVRRQRRREEEKRRTPQLSWSTMDSHDNDGLGRLRLTEGDEFPSFRDLSTLSVGDANHDKRGTRSGAETRGGTRSSITSTIATAMGLRRSRQARRPSSYDNNGNERTKQQQEEQYYQDLIDRYGYVVAKVMLAVSLIMFATAFPFRAIVFSLGAITVHRFWLITSCIYRTQLTQPRGSLYRLRRTIAWEWEAFCNGVGQGKYFLALSAGFYLHEWTRPIEKVRRRREERLQQRREEACGWGC